MHDPTDIDRLADYLLTQIHAFIKMGDYEEFSTAEAMAALEIVKVELIAGALKDSGFHRWPEGIDQAAAAKLRGEPTIEEPDIVLDLDEDSEEDEDDED